MTVFNQHYDIRKKGMSQKVENDLHTKDEDVDREKETTNCQYSEHHKIKVYQKIFSLIKMHDVITSFKR